MSEFDLAVIGAGPGGYVSAIRAAQLGLSVALIEKETELGGTCLNVGCIPSKALLDSSEHVWAATHSFDAHGIKLGKVQVDFLTMMKRKQDVVKTTTKGIDYLIKKNKITPYKGLAFFKSSTEIIISGKEGPETITAKKTIIATGSEPMPIPSIPFDGKSVISSTGALALKKIPKEMLIIGGGGHWC